MRDRAAKGQLRHRITTTMTARPPTYWNSLISPGPWVWEMPVAE